MTLVQISDLQKNKKSKISNTIYSSVSGSITAVDVREGDYIKEASLLFTLTNLNTLWVDVQIYSNEMIKIIKGGKVSVFPEGMPEEEIEGEILFVNPVFEAERKVNIMKVIVNNKQHKLKSGMLAYVSMLSENKSAIVLPVDAVIRAANNSVVWIQNSNGSFEIRYIKTGIENKNKIEIYDGLKVGERVVISGAYLINSEYLFKRGMFPKEEHSNMQM